MVWIWQLQDWPNFQFDQRLLESYENEFLKNSGFLIGAYQHINTVDQKEIFIDIISDEVISTSEIEGSYLNRGSVQLSLKNNFGLLKATDKKVNIPPAEQGIANIITDVHKNFQRPLTHEILYNWHKMLIADRTDLLEVGQYRSHHDDMQIVSGFVHKPKIHYVAPPSKFIKQEMDNFIAWYNNTTHLRILTKAALAHLYFLLIHPFEDGNGRIARAISEQILFVGLKQPLLISISTVIRDNKKKYYDMLNKHDVTLDITEWLQYFAEVVIEAQKYSINSIDFIIKKAKFYDEHKDLLNTRQQKVIAKIFAAGSKGFKGGLSAENYLSITKTSRATATRDLQDLVNKKIFNKIGELKSTRYYLIF
jgi:Fic family protein